MADILGLAETNMARARRKLKKRIAAAIINAMAETDADYAFIAKRLRDKPAKIEAWITGLITGRTKDLDEVSDLLLAMNCELEFGLRRYQEPRRPTEEQSQRPKEQAAGTHHP